MDYKEICKLWIEYLKESNFRKENGESKYFAYVDRIKAVSQTRRLTPWPTVRNISDYIETFIDRAYSEANSEGDTSFEHFKKKLIRNIKLAEQTSLLLHIHCPGIPPRGGQKNVLQEIGKLLKTKLQDVKNIREFYCCWTEPGERVTPELAMYLELYRAQKRGVKAKDLREVALKFAEKINSKRLSKKFDEEERCYKTLGYLEESQIRNSV